MCFFLSSFAVNGDFDSRRHPVSKIQATNPPSETRQSQVFHGYPNYPSSHSVGPANTPTLHDGMDSLSGRNGANHTAVAASAPKTEDEEDEDGKQSVLVGMPEKKRRKFIIVDDPDRNTRVRVRVMLDQVDMEELPDSYRKTNSVYPRSYYPIQVQSPSCSVRGNRFFDGDDPAGGPVDGQEATRGRTSVPVSMGDGAIQEFVVPKLSRAKRDKEIALNDLGYRMNWSQSRVFANRTMFLQRARESRRAFVLVLRSSD